MIRKKYNVVAALTLALLAGCTDTTPKTGYVIKLSDGWTQSTLYCASYEKADRHLICYDDNAEMKSEIFLTDELRVYIKRLGVEQ